MVLEDLSKSNVETSPACDPVEQKVCEYIAQLPPDIRDHIIEEDLIGLTLDHPMSFIPRLQVLAGSEVFPPDQVRESIRSMEKLHRELCAKGDFEGALFLVTKRHRREYLLNLIRNHGAEKLLDAVNAVWVSVDYFYAYYDLWDEVWEDVVRLGEARLGVMDTDERAFFDALPDMLTVYRGFRGDCGEYGWSWTLDREQAEWFARRRSGDTPMVGTVTVPKNEVLAYFSSRNEAEIVIHPNYLDCCADIEIEVLNEKRAAA